MYKVEQEEKTADDAPCHYSAEEASAWASGYNAAMDYLAKHRLRALESAAVVAEGYKGEAFATEHENRCFTGIARNIRALGEVK